MQNLLEKSVIRGAGSDIQTVSYDYNYFGQRISKKNGLEEVRYLTDITRDHYNLLSQSINGKTMTFTYDDNVVSFEREGTRNYYQLDELGSTVYLTGTDGAAYSPKAYDPFGNILNPLTGERNGGRPGYTKEGNLIQPFAFTGYREEETGLYYAQARNYDPVSGRFTSEDRVRGILTMPDTVNHYLYCFNDPTVYIDDNGLWGKILSNIGEGISNAFNKAEQWCEDHKEVVQTVVAVTTLTAAVAVTVATCGAGAPALAAAATVTAGCLATGTVVGVDYATHGGSFVEGFNRGVTNAALTTTAVITNPLGAISGLGMQLGGDIFSGHMSSLESYTAAACSGSVMLETGSAAMGGMTYPVVRNSLESIFGVSYHGVGDTYTEMAEAFMLGNILDMNFGYHPYTREQQLCTEDSSSTGIPEEAKNYRNESEGNYNNSFDQLNTKVDTVNLEKGTWDMGPVARGDAIDSALDNNVGHNYPTIDRIDADGVVTSVKSRDLTSSTYQNGSRLEYQIKKDVDSLNSYSGGTWNGVDISSDVISGKQLQIVVPNVELTEAQIEAINNATAYANEKGIDIIITVGKEIE
ncbi:RHS repeat-associated core domain-containing protein [Butyrivibrio sp. INlla14]|uniref:RHS repeat-associated core domain-containing protein n=1 Tax=Butyrivibrio sp. INlla14 TaxID=1520808 RepID=UPI0008764E10|nr:RHS repeat-associated core domain-containing protein [Butyrivibrio sp. INlla14]SCY74894.1 RHS repeat-associated core domain-containing protein [Butyrivibrio sp. INlla14]